MDIHKVKYAPTYLVFYLVGTWWVSGEEEAKRISFSAVNIATTLQTTCRHGPRRCRTGIPARRMQPLDAPVAWELKSYVQASLRCSR